MQARRNILRGHRSFIRNSTRSLRIFVTWEVFMPDAESIQPTRHAVNMDQATPFLITQDKIFSFRSSPIAFARWTITTWGIDFLGLPADPRTVHAQIHFPQNV